MTLDRQLPLAIVGLACRLPSVAAPADLFSPGDPFSALPSEWSRQVGVPFVLRGAQVAEMPLDFRHFRIPPNQLAQMHRMERLLLQTLAAALDDAGHSPQKGPNGRCAIYLGATGLGVDLRIDHTLRLRAPDWHDSLADALRGSADAEALMQSVRNRVEAEAPQISADSISTTASIAAGRVSALYGTWGGHLALDAGVASSLAALKLAAQALAEGHADCAVVGAISPLLTPSTFALLKARGWLAEQEVRPLDQRAGGTLPGEGAVALMLRRFEDAHREGQRIYAVLRGVGEASDPLHPGVSRLSHLVDRSARAALESAGMEPDQVVHLETQAPGIPELEDEELFGLRAGYACRREEPLSVGTAVPRVGFQQAASGLVSVVRAALALHQKMRPPSAAVELARRAPVSEFALPAGSHPLREREHIGVSSPAWGGAAFHAVLGPTGALSPRPRLRRPSTDASEKIAIVGMGAIAPGARDAPALWKNILSKAEAIRDLPTSHFEVERYLEPVLEAGAQRNLPRLAGVVELPQIDPSGLRLPPAAMKRLDRAVLLAVKAGEEAVHRAGYEEGRWDVRRVRTVFGQLPLRERELEIERRFVFERYLAIAQAALLRAGVPSHRVESALERVRTRVLSLLLPLEADAHQHFSGVSCAARLAARFGFLGGALAVDAACASSLAAVHVGVLALLRHEADVVIAGGVAYNLVPEYFVPLCVLGALSPRGSFPYDDRADGFVPSEGAGAVVLKRLADAEAARDRVLAVIAGVGASSDGHGTSLYAPNPEGQARALQRALELAQVDPTWVDLIEGHGTGTRRGDLCEATAYGRVFEARGLDHPVALGSIKSQVGHLSGAAGMMGLIKTTYALSEQTLPPMNGGEYPNPEIAFERLPLALSLESRPWRVPQSGLRRAGVSAFGLGGSNYHLVLEEHDNLQLRDRRVDPAPAKRPHPIPARGLLADRWAVDLVPLSMGEQKRFNFEGKRIVLLGPNARLLGALERGLSSRGATAVRLVLEGERNPLEVSARIGQILEREGRLDGVIDAGGFLAPEELLVGGVERFRQTVRETSARWFGVGRALFRRFQEAPDRGACYAAITAMGGDFGFTGDGGNVHGGSTAGFLKGLKQELPSLVTKVVDFEPSAAPDWVAERTLREIEEGSDRVEIGYLGGRRFAVGMKRSTFSGEEDPLRVIDPSWVLLFSGGGRGAVFEVAKAVARLGPRVVVTGRTPLPSGDEPYLSLDDTAFDAFRKEEMVRLHKADPAFTPVKFAERFDAVVRARELWRNMQEAFSLGIPLQYEVCDVRDADQVQALVGRIREMFGRIDGVVHGAMVESSKSLLDKTPAGVEATLEVKAIGLLNLIEATRGDALKLFMCFGSGAGRFGNRGQTDYCAANDLMSKCLMAFAHRAAASTRCVTIDWTAWESVGAAARNRQMVESTGVSFISPGEGVFWFINEFMLGSHEREVAIFDERLFREWPFLGSSAEGPAARRAWDDRGELLVSSDYPLVDGVLRRTEEEVLAFRRLEMGRDRFLDQHQLYGVPILPCTFGVELLAEGASLVRPDLCVLWGESIEIETPLKLFRNQSVSVEIRARVLRAQGEQQLLVQVETRSQIRLGKTERLQERLHHRGVFALGPPPEVRPSAGAQTEQPGALPGARARSIFHLAKDPVYLGPLFCRAEWVYVGPSQVEGQIRAPRQHEIFSHIGKPSFQMDPLLLDTAFQVAANWDGHHHRLVSIPVGVQRVARGRLRRINEGAHVKAWPVRVEEKEVLYDAEVLGEDGSLLLEVKGLRLRRLDPGNSGGL